MPKMRYLKKVKIAGSAGSSSASRTRLVSSGWELC